MKINSLTDMEREEYNRLVGKAIRRMSNLLDAFYEWADVVGELKALRDTINVDKDDDADNFEVVDQVYKAKNILEEKLDHASDGTDNLEEIDDDDDE